MPLSISEARDSLLGIVKTTIDGSSQSSIVVKYDDTELDPKNNGDKNWVKVIAQHLNGSQATLSGGLGGNSTRYTYVGILAIECYFVKNDGLTASDIFVSEIMGGLINHNVSELFIRNVRAIETGTVDTWFLTTVFADFEYDTVR